MSFVSISDVHIRNEFDERYHNILKFLNHPLTQQVDEVYLLGDIFDLMVGPHTEYISKYKDFFSGIEKLLREGKIIHFFEGNHDLHIKKLFFKFLRSRKLEPDKFQIHHQPILKKIGDVKFYFSHGDELEPGNYSYKLYKYLLMSKPTELLVTAAPYRLVDMIGTKASQKSKERSRRYYNEDVNRAKFRQGSIWAAKNEIEYIIAGHSHIKDNVELRGPNKPFHYVNNGFFPETKSFIYYDSKKISFINLEESLP